MRFITNLFILVFEFVFLSRIIAWLSYFIKKKRNPEINRPNLKNLLNKITGVNYAGLILWSITIIGAILLLLLKVMPQNTIGSPIEANDYTAKYYVLLSENRDGEGIMIPATIHVTSEESEFETENGSQIESTRVYYLLELRYPNGEVEQFEDYEVALSNTRSALVSELECYVLLTDEKINP